MKNYLFCFLVGLMTTFNAKAQSNPNGLLVRSTLGTSSPSSSTFSSTYNYYVQQSIGQSSVIGTFSNEGIVLRQGFLQSVVLDLSGQKNPDFQLNCKIHPNPFVNNFTLSFEEEISTNILLSIIDLSGKIYFTKEYLPSQSINVTLTVPASSYIIRATANNKEVIKKLIKTN